MKSRERIMDSWGPLLSRTHQRWKMRAMMIGTPVAGLLIVAPFAGPFTPGEAALCDGISGVVALMSIGIPFVGIRCPNCGCHWLWRAATQSQTNWLSWLRAQQVCPECAKEFDRAG